MAIGPPTGMRDWLPQETLLRQQLMDTIGTVYRRYGYLPIDTPAMEDLAVLLGKGGGENEKLLFKVLKRGDKLKDGLQDGDLADYGLRFDLTVPLARFVATHQGKLPKVFRRYHIGPVWRADRPQKGRYREFYQCDIDVVGGASSAYEVEIITATERVLVELHLGPYWFRISDKRLLPLLLRGLGVAEGKITPTLTLMDKADKIPWEQFEAELNGILEKGSDSWPKVWQLVRQGRVNKDYKVLLTKGTDYDHYEEIFQQIQDQKIREEIATICRNLDEIIVSVRHINPNSRLIFHPTLVRGMDYYTGPVYEAVVESFSSSILGGGRYDGLIGTFAGKNVPAVGCSIGFERLLTLLQEREKGVALQSDRVLLMPQGSDVNHTHQVAEKLRGHGLAVETYFEADEPSKQFQYAEAAGIAWAIREVRQDLALLVRHLPTRVDSVLPFAEFEAKLRAK
jgi:histidyl-tRNA synthetase